MTNDQRPPCLNSQTLKVLVKPAGPHHRASLSEELSAAKTSSTGADTSREVLNVVTGISSSKVDRRVWRKPKAGNQIHPPSPGCCIGWWRRGCRTVKRLSPREPSPCAQSAAGLRPSLALQRFAGEGVTGCAGGNRGARDGRAAGCRGLCWPGGCWCGQDPSRLRFDHVRYEARAIPADRPGVIAQAIPLVWLPTTRQQKQGSVHLRNHERGRMDGFKVASAPDPVRGRPSAASAQAGEACAHAPGHQCAAGL